MTGLHIIRKRLASGIRYYVYAWRGGPQIHVSNGKYPVITTTILAKQQRALSDQHKAPQDAVTIDKLISLYESSPRYKNKSPGTKDEYQRHLGRISQQFGKLPLEVFNDRRTRGQIVNWKNQWEDKPRTADMAALMMSILLDHGVQIGLLDINVAARIPKIHKADRSDLIWEQEHWDKFYGANPPKHIIDVVELASMTGLRMGDILSLTWEAHVSHNAIIVDRTNKNKGRAVVPLIPALALWLKNRTDRTGHIVKTSRHTPWTASGFKASYRKKMPAGFDRHFHDLRGTYVTKLILAGLTDQDVAYIVGWKAKNVAEIRARYVNEQRVITNLLSRLQG